MAVGPPEDDDDAAGAPGPGASAGWATGSIGELGEFGLIAAVTRDLPQGPSVLLGPGDDAAVVAVPDGRAVVSTDLLVEGVHFRRDWSDAVDVGHKAAAQSLADIAAMGAVATALVVGLAAPPELSASWVRGLTTGLRDECAQVGASIVGGDVVRSSGTITIAVTALGDLRGRAAVTRAGARVGDLVGVRGRLGWSAAGLAVLRRGFRSPRVLVDAHRRPAPPYGGGPEAAGLGATAMCDTSDGLLADLGHIAAASGVGAVLDAGAFEVPGPMADAARAIGTDPLVWVLTGGEDHALVATFPRTTVLPAAWVRIGTVTDAGDAGPSVEVRGVDPAVLAAGTGHDHFRTSPRS